MPLSNLSLDADTNISSLNINGGTTLGLGSASSDKFDNGTEGGPNANKKRRKREKWSN